MSAAAIAPAGPEEPPALIFQEDIRARSHWRLGLMILVSLLGHAASFYVLQVAYTPNGSLLPPPARVMMVPLDQPQNAPLARWLALTDSTLATQPPALADGAGLDTLNFRYVPSYAGISPAFRALDPVASEGVAAAPRPRPPGPVVMSEAPAEKSLLPAEMRSGFLPLPSRVVFSRDIDAFTPRPLPPMQFTGSPGIKPLEPTVFLVGVRPEGGTPFLFPVRQATASNAGAGADEADEFARDYLARLAFAPAAPDGVVVWGRATFYWGGDPRPETR